MSKIKNFVSFIAIIIIIVMISLNYEKIYTKFTSYVNDFKNSNKREIVIKSANEYSKAKNYRFVQQTDDFIPKNYNDLVNILYTILDKGWDSFTFYCDEDYASCLTDLDAITTDKPLLASIGNYVHPFNSYSQIKVVYDDSGEVTINISHLYSKEEIKKINKEVERIQSQIFTSNMDERTKIKTLHDYIINHTKYDTVRSETGTSSYDSSKATGVLFQGYGICSGYSDTMAIFLFNLGIDSFKVSSETHVWNTVWLDDSWYHLDATWDDPVSEDGSDNLIYKYYLINSDQLRNEDTKTTDHDFNNNYYFLN